MQRILQVVTKMNRGGMESMIMNLYRNIDREKIQFDFLVHRKEKGDFDDEIKDLGGNIYYVPSINPFHHRKYLKALNAFFIEHKYEIVHSHINTFSMYVLRAAKKANINHRIAHSHIDRIAFNHKFFFKLYCKKKINKYLTHRFACGEKAGRWLFGNANFTILNNAIDISLFQFNDKSDILYRNQLGLGNSFVLGHIGRFYKQKNHSFIIDIFNEIIKKQVDAKLLLIGEGSLKSEIERKVKRFNLSDKVLFLGVRQDIPQLLSCMNILAFPSLYEGLPLTLIEAQANGLQICASDSISEKAKLTDLVHFISLKHNAIYWAEEILNYKVPYERKFYLEELRVSGYDIQETGKWLENFYQTNT
jgi:glycosyltransferase involved in cell wall biosynthesis